MESESDNPSSSSPLPSDADVCRFLYGGQPKSMYPLYVKFHTTMVDECPPSGIEAMKKAVQKRDNKEALNIMAELFQGSGSAELYRIESEITLKGVTNSDGFLRTDTNLRKDLLYMDLRMGITSSDILVKLDETDIENHYYYVSFLSLYALDLDQRLTAIHQCQKALKIDTVFDKGNPEDPKGPRSKIRNLFEYMKDKHERIESIWQSMMDDAGFINLSFNELDDYYSNNVKDESARQVIKEALDFCISYGSWTFWQCCCCDEKFDSPDPLISHFVAHLPTMQSQLQSPIVTTETCKIISVDEPIWIDPDVGSSDLIVSPTCLLNPNADSRQPAFPLRDTLITILSYRFSLGQWIDFRNSRKRIGTQLIQFMTRMKMQLEEEAKSAGETSVATEENAQTSTEKIHGILEKKCAEIDSKFKETGLWSYRNEITGEVELFFVDNPFGAYDYRDVLLPLLKSCIAGRVENHAEEQCREGMKQAGNQ